MMEQSYNKLSWHLKNGYGENVGWN